MSKIIFDGIKASDLVDCVMEAHVDALALCVEPLKLKLGVEAKAYYNPSAFSCMLQKRTGYHLNKMYPWYVNESARHDADIVNTRAGKFSIEMKDTERYSHTWAKATKVKPHFYSYILVKREGFLSTDSPAIKEIRVGHLKPDAFTVYSYGPRRLSKKSLLENTEVIYARPKK